MPSQQQASLPAAPKAALERVPRKGGLIFLCDNETQSLCENRRLVADSRMREELVLSCKQGCYIFLYNTQSKLLYGIYRAAKDGGINLDPTAWPDSRGGSRFPAQVKVDLVQCCTPLKPEQLGMLCWRRGRVDRVLDAEAVVALKRCFIANSPPCESTLAELTPSALDEIGDTLESWPSGEPPYLPWQRTLTVGDGNLSFSLSLAKMFRERHAWEANNLFATTLDVESELFDKYGEAQMSSRLIELRGTGANVLDGIDARLLGGNLARCLGHAELFDTVIWNFPHAGSERGSGSLHKQLLRCFFSAVAPLVVQGGQVHLSLIGTQYLQWGMCSAARDAGFERIGSVRFAPQSFPGYSIAHEGGEQKGESMSGFSNGVNRRSRTYIFRRAPTDVSFSSAVPKWDGGHT